MRGRAICAGMPSTTPRRCLSEPSTRRTSPSSPQTLQGQKEQQPRWKRCTRLTDQALGEAVGQDWVKQNFRPQPRTTWRSWCTRSKPPGRGHQATALDERGHQDEAEKKLDAIRNKIGYPDKWRDYSTFDRQARRPPRQRGPRRRSSRTSATSQAGQAGRRDGVGHDAADRERLLQPAA